MGPRERNTPVPIAGTHRQTNLAYPRHWTASASRCGTNRLILWSKIKYISPHWTPEQLEMVARARRVLGFGGAFPPYDGLITKLTAAKTFEEALRLREHPGDKRRRVPKNIAGTVETPTPRLTIVRSEFRELLNDPSTLSKRVDCASYGDSRNFRERAFALQDYAGKYVGYVCPNCQPNRKWINGLWRTVLGEDWTARVERTTLPQNILTRTVH